MLYNAILQLAGDPRWWPRDLPLSRTTLLWRTVTKADAAAWPPAGHAARLRALANAQFLEAKLWFLCVTYLYVLAAVFATIAFLSDDGESQQRLATVISVTFQILAVLARARAIRLHAIAHEADWRELIMDALGPTKPEVERALLLENMIADEARNRAGEIPNYYGSNDLPGVERLARNLRETAFFTAALYKTASVRAVIFAVLVIAVPAAPAMYGLVSGVPIDASLAVLAVSGVLPLWDVFARVRSWRASATTLDDVVVGLAETNTFRAVLPLLTDAVIATATAPPIPRRVYSKNAQELRDRWARFETVTTSDDAEKERDEGV